jgi:hypothetical protein
MNTFETSLTPAQALQELKAQQSVIEHAIALLEHGELVKEIRDAKTLLENWNLQAEFLLGELSVLLCLTTINPNTTLQTYPRLSQLGTLARPKLSECRSQLPIVS